MKIMLFLILFLTSFHIWANDQQDDPTVTDIILNNSDSTESSKSDTVYSTINRLGLYFDSHMTAQTGADNVLLLHCGFTRLEERIIGSSWSSENTALTKSVGILGRLAKYVILDIPVNFLFITGNHEYFGHGARYREFDLGKIDYHIGIPAPYGDGGGFANVSNYSRAASDHERIAIWQGGFETHDILTRKLSLRWISDGKSNYQENILYFWTWQDRFQYIQSNFESLPNDINGPLNDPEGYVWFLNHQSGIVDPNNLKFNIEDLQKKNIVNLINPFVWYSLYGQLVSYMYNGKTMVELPMIHIGDFKYLPSLRMSLTPFGPQYHVENYVAFGRTASLVDVSVGDQTFYSDWWGMHVQILNFYEKKKFSFDGRLNIWKQPGLEYEGGSANSKDSKVGMAFSIRGFYDIINWNHPISISSELGYKMPGFLQGYVLDQAPILKFGIGIRI